MSITYMLRSCDADRVTSHGFKWPKSGPVKAPDWKRTRQCGNGLHGLLKGEGDYTLTCTLNYTGENPDLFREEIAQLRWLVVEVDTRKMVDLKGKVKVKEGTVIYCGTLRSAFQVLAKNLGHHWEFKHWMLQDPQRAVLYGLLWGACPEAEEAACKTSKTALWYAHLVKPSTKLRRVVCKVPKWAYYYAQDVEKGAPSDTTRNAACRSPNLALSYAMHVDAKPTLKTYQCTRYKDYYENLFRSLGWGDLLASFETVKVL